MNSATMIGFPFVVRPFRVVPLPGHEAKASHYRLPLVGAGLVPDQGMNV